VKARNTNTLKSMSDGGELLRRVYFAKANMSARIFQPDQSQNKPPCTWLRQSSTVRTNPPSFTQFRRPAPARGGSLSKKMPFELVF
jgi:hypothetical protein